MVTNDRLSWIYFYTKIKLGLNTYSLIYKMFETTENGDEKWISITYGQKDRILFQKYVNHLKNYLGRSL